MTTLETVEPVQFRSPGELVRRAYVSDLIDAITYPEDVEDDEETGVSVFKCPDCRRFSARIEPDAEYVYRCATCAVEGTRDRLERAVRESAPALRRLSRFDESYITTLNEMEAAR